MPNLYGHDLSRRDLLKRLGAIDQIASARRIRLEDGPEDGVSAVEIRTGGGLSYTVVPSRALDIAAAEIDGVPLAWRTGAGEMHPAYTFRSLGWNVGWFGGLLATCGLDNVGNPGEDEMGAFAQHGHLNGAAARQVGYGGRWHGEQYLLWVEGEMRQKDGWMPGSYDVVMRRRLESELGGRTIAITDQVENMGTTTAPLMLLYHVNLGWPVVEPGAEVISRRKELTHLTGGQPPEGPLQVALPSPTYKNNNYTHDMVVDVEGFAEAALINDRLQVGLSVRYRAAELPYFNQWKQLVEGRYVFALEPLNTRGGNRPRARERGTLPTLAPGETRDFRVELTALRGAEELAAARSRLA